MKSKTFEIKEITVLPKNLESIFNVNQYCVVDIETTGFSRQNDVIILIGILYEKNNKIHIKQFFAENPSEESELLYHFIQSIKNYDLFVTYNGDAFDIPFINSRLYYHNLNYQMETEDCFDLMKVVRNNKKILGLENYKLKSVESALGYFRDDKISGKESIEMYLKYVKNGDIKFKDIILKHNYDDIYYLPKILKIYDLISDISYLTIPLKYKDSKVIINLDINNSSIKGNILNITGYTSKHSFPMKVYYDESYSIKWDTFKGFLEFKLQVFESKLSDGNKCYYLNKKDFPYSIDCIDQTKYEVPKNIIIVKEGNQLMLNNLKIFIKEIMVEIFNSI